MCYVVFFFFQAEDGIRDTSVTGVQTCALPISPDARIRLDLKRSLASGVVFGIIWRCGPPKNRIPTNHDQNKSPVPLRPFSKIGRASCRKECRSRWSQCHKKKNNKRRKIRKYRA